MKRLLKWTVVITGLLAALFALAVFTLDFGFLRGPLEHRASAALGHAVHIDGDLSIRIGGTTRVELRGLRVENPDWIPDPDMLRAGHVLLELDTRTLWRSGPLGVLRFTAEDLRILLVESDAGLTNWSMATDKPRATTADSGLPLLLHQASLDRMQIELRSPRLEKPLDAQVDRLRQQLREDGSAEISLNGTVNGENLDFQGAVAPFAELAGGKNIRIEGEGQVGLGQFSFNALVDDLNAPRRPEIQLEGHSPSLARLTSTLHLGDWGEGAVDFAFNTRVDGEQLVALATARAGKLQADLTARMTSLAEFDRLTLRAKASGENLGLVARVAGYDGWPEAPFSVDIDSQRNGGQLTIDQFDFQVAGSRLQLNGMVPDFPSIVGSEVHLDASGQRLEVFSDALGAGDLPAGPFAIQGEISARNGRHTQVDLTFEATPASGRLQGDITDTENFELNLSIGGDDLAALKRLKGLGGIAPGPFRVDGTARGDSAGTTFDFEFSAAPGSGHASGLLQRDQGLRLSLDMGGSLASRFGQLFGLGGLPGTPWILRLVLDQPSDQTYAIHDLSFETDGMKLAAKGELGAKFISQGTRLDFSLDGPDLSRLQPMAPQGFSLAAAPFSVRGQVSAAPEAWLLQDLEARVGAVQIQADGSVGTGEHLRGTQLNLVVEGDDLGRFYAPPGPIRLPEGPFHSSGRLVLGDTTIRLEKIQLTADALNLRLDAEAPWPPGPGSARFDIDWRGQDVTRTLPSLGGADLAAVAYRVHGSGLWSDGRIEARDIQLDLGDAHLELKGILDLPPDASQTDLQLQVSAPNLSHLVSVHGARWGELPIELDTRLTGTSDHMKLSRLHAQVGESEITGLFSIDLSQDKPDFDLKMSTDLLNLRPFLNRQASKPQKEKDGKAGGRVIPETPLPFGWLDAANGRFAIAADQLLLRRHKLQNNLISGRLIDGQLQISEMGIDTSGGRLTASLDVLPTDGDAVTARVSIHSKALILDFSDVPEEEKRREPPFDIDIDLEGSGTTVRDLATSLEGSFSIYSPGGVVKTPGDLEKKSRPLAAVVMAVSPTTAMLPEIEIACFAAVGRAHQGIVELEPGVALQSSRINAFSSGTIDLSRETLDLDIKSSPRRLVAISAGELVSPFVKVTGTLADPSIGIDATGTLLTGGAAVLSGGLTLLAQKALGHLKNSDPCKRILQSANPENPQP